jgi:D-beta-D-heptose 7-phosphate kinase/D-beta-D-heptose 1-phosphate adenosyltransferase
MSDTNRKPHITVVGDLILDRYLIGDATKLNPEMPGVVIRVDKEDDRLGGAAAVAMIAAGFGARVTLAGVVGNDEAGDKLRQLLDTHGIESHILTDERPTTWKQRIVARDQLRPDRCDRESTVPIDSQAEQFLSTVPLGDVLLVSDYGKGVLTQRILQLLGCRAHAASIPILVDPARSRNWSDYGQVTLIKANLAEATEAWDSEECPPMALAKGLSEKHACHVVMTLGERGLICAELGTDPQHLPAVPVEARDVCGAGDTVMAALGVTLARAYSLAQACQVATTVAGEQVATIGITLPSCELANSDPKIGVPTIERAVA